MTHKKSTDRAYALFASLLILILMSLPVNAVANTANQGGAGSSGGSAQQGQATESGSENSGGSNSQGEQSKGLNAEQKKVCEQSENRVQNMFSNMNRLGEAQLSFMNTVKERVQNYYDDSGMMAADYDEALAKVNQLQQNTQNQVQATVQTSSQYGCDKDDPKGAAQQYKTQVKSQIGALKEYRTALKQYIEVVKNAEGGEQ